MSDFKKNQGGIQPSNSTGRDPKDQGGAPVTGFVQSPDAGELAQKGPGPGIGNSGRRIK